MPNGNTLICSGFSGYFSEIDSTGNLVWAYRNPVTGTGLLTQGNPVNSGVNSIFVEETGAVFTGVVFPEAVAAAFFLGAAFFTVFEATAFLGAVFFAAGLVAFFWVAIVLHFFYMYN
jgi:hypothetical protein